MLVKLSSFALVTGRPGESGAKHPIRTNVPDLEKKGPPLEPDSDGPSKQAPR
ncbi:MAG: hypothetical protein QOG72_2237 [Sphingomonadales bacterium]|jgi:hypothetical protein|nr:hypothetical protein [Sphingomonadales bacterium]